MDNQPKLILCVEDDEDDIALIEETVNEIDSSLRIVAKPNGKEALMFLHRQKEQHYLPCLILLDFNMPVMNGNDVLDAIMKDDVFKEIHVIVFTTSSSQREQLICESYGVEIVTKPHRIAEFKRVLNHLVVRCI